MSKEMTVIVLGLWVIVIPHLGVPNSWLVVITTLSGVAVVAVGLYMRARLISRGRRAGAQHPFVENSSHDEPAHIA